MINPIASIRRPEHATELDSKIEFSGPVKMWDPRQFEKQVRALGKRVRGVRTARGWSQHDVEREAKFFRSCLSDIEHGKRNFTLWVLWRLAVGFHVHWADLLDDRRVDQPRPWPRSENFDTRLAIFGMRLYKARVLLNVSQQTVTDRTGVSRSAISVMEDGAQNITLETLSRLAVGLRVHWADLLDDGAANQPHLLGTKHAVFGRPAPPETTGRTRVGRRRLALQDTVWIPSLTTSPGGDYVVNADADSSTTSPPAASAHPRRDIRRTGNRRAKSP